MGLSLRGVPKLNDISQGLFFAGFGGLWRRPWLRHPELQGYNHPLDLGLDVNKHFCHTRGLTGIWASFLSHFLF